MFGCDNLRNIFDSVCLGSLTFLTATSLSRYFPLKTAPAINYCHYIAHVYSKFTIVNNTS